MKSIEKVLSIARQEIGYLISIHSTTRVETQFWDNLRSKIGDFNPLHHEGGDRIP